MFFFHPPLLRYFAPIRSFAFDEFIDPVVGNPAILIGRNAFVLSEGMQLE
jgi:hypothetical protein